MYCLAILSPWARISWIKQLSSIDTDTINSQQNAYKNNLGKSTSNKQYRQNNLNDQKYDRVITTHGKHKGSQQQIPEKKEKASCIVCFV